MGSNNELLGKSQRVTDGIELHGFERENVAISAVAAQSVAQDQGLYDVWSDVDCYLKVAAVANDVTILTGYLLRANNTLPLIVPKNMKIGAIAGGAGTLCIHRVQ